ncbi:hypothetical protein [Moheibacter sediminis]|uniref:Uncharacterized protein n=1 Tax=Moheibacter sediminis TaxID=1434700 RepID=A0A1W2C7G7_9FLAO|nr:hypothetical protein [Moheibacter sediminis]SMC81046.1 hypothetical protein SAMN06296427_1098 [Moheibacter sediminis]
MDIKKILLVIFLSILNYAITFSLGYFFSYLLYDRLSETAFIYILSIVYFFNLLIVLAEWWIIKKYFLKEQEFTNKINSRAIGNILIVLIPTFLFAGYKLFTGNLLSFNINTDFDKIINHIIVYILLMPVIEQIIYGDILFKILIKTKIKIALVATIISFLYMLTSMDPYKIDLMYLVYTFIVGMGLFFVRLKNGLFFSIVAHSLINLVILFFYLINGNVSHL